MKMYRKSAYMSTVVVITLLVASHQATAQPALEGLPSGWQSQPIEDFISTMHNAVSEGLSDADRALAASQWMDANDWTAASRKHRVQLVELLNSDKLNKLNFSVRWTGYLVPDHTGNIKLSLWHYYKEDALDTKVWLGGDLVLDCSGPEATRVFRSDDIALTAGERVPITVEMRFNRTNEHKIAKPNVILSWESEALTKQIIPAENYQLPDDYTGQAVHGLKGEYFGSHTLEGLVETRLDPELSYVWEAFAILPEYGERQRQIVEPMIPEILASMNDPAEVGIEHAGGFWCAYALEEVLTTRESIRILDALKGAPELNAARTKRDLFLSYWRFRYLPDHLSADLVAQWCRAHPLVESQFGTYPNYDLSEYYGNYNYPWRLGYHLTYVDDDTYLETLLVEEDGSCNVTLAAILSFAHKKRGTLDDWYTHLELQINDLSRSSDAKATWLLARSFAEEIRRKGEPNPLAGRRWLDRAFGEAQSPFLRKHILREIVCRLAAWGKHEEVNSLLAGMESQFSSASDLQEFSEWRNATNAIVSRLDEIERSERQAADQAYIDRLMERQARAQSKGEMAAASELQQLIDKAEAAKSK